MEAAAHAHLRPPFSRDNRKTPGEKIGKLPKTLSSMREVAVKTAASMQRSEQFLGHPSSPPEDEALQKSFAASLLHVVARVGYSFSCSEPFVEGDRDRNATRRRRTLSDGLVRPDPPMRPLWCGGRRPPVRRPPPLDALPALG